MPSESRPITRLRPSLSCLTCRRRKVRCGREQPACRNCVVMNVPCAYENQIRHLKDSRSKKKPAKSPPDWNSNQIKNAGCPQETWTDLARRENSPFQSHAHAEGGSTDSSELINYLTRDTSPASSLQMTPGVDVHEGQGLMKPFLPFMRDGNLACDKNWEGHADLNALILRDTAGQVEPTQNFNSALSAALSSSGPPATGADQPSFTAPQTGIGPLQAYSQRNFTAVDAPVSVSGQPPIFKSCAASERDMAPTEAGDESYNDGHLSLWGGGQTRYVESSFWALIKGHESPGNDYLRERFSSRGDTLTLHIDTLGLANLLKQLPTKPVCDILLQSFLVGVRPIHPLIHVPTFREDYDKFWLWYRNNSTSLPDQKIFNDPTFLALLFAILYCGASTASPSLWNTPILHELKNETLLEQLKELHHNGLKVCQHERHPTLNTLVASLLGFSCVRSDDEPVESLAFVSIALRIAQRMGLHRDGSTYGLDAVTSELRRRVWWHIVWLDVQASAMNGMQTCCGAADPGAESQMVSELCDEALSRPSVENSSFTPRELAGTRSSPSMFLAIGRYEAARVKRLVINRLSRVDRFRQSQMASLVVAVERLHLKIDALLARLPIQGIPEKGYIPSRLKHASPLTHERLYDDELGKASVFTSWVRIMLTMQKSEVAILLQKSFLGRADSKSEQEQKMWNSAVRLCSLYLGNFLQLAHFPAFAPYAWFCPTRYPPLEAMFVILTYLEHQPASPCAQLARHLVDEVIEVFAPDGSNSLGSGEQAPHFPNHKALHSKPLNSAWAMIRALRAKVDVSPDLIHPMDQRTTLHRSSLRQTSVCSSKTVPQPLENKPSPSTTSTSDVIMRAGLPSDPIFPPPLFNLFDDCHGLLDLSSFDARPSPVGQAGDEGFKLDSNPLESVSGAGASPLVGFADTVSSTPMAIDDCSDSDDMWSQLKVAGGAEEPPAGWSDDFWGAWDMEGGRRPNPKQSNGGGGPRGFDDKSSISAVSQGGIGSDAGMASDESWIDAWIA